MASNARPLDFFKKKLFRYCKNGLRFLGFVIMGFSRPVEGDIDPVWYRSHLLHSTREAGSAAKREKRGQLLPGIKRKRSFRFHVGWGAEKNLLPTDPFCFRAPGQSSRPIRLNPRPPSARPRPRSRPPASFPDREGEGVGLLFRRLVLLQLRRRRAPAPAPSLSAVASTSPAPSSRARARARASSPAALSSSNSAAAARLPPPPPLS
jgi:hypothetical protein